MEKLTMSIWPEMGQRLGVSRATAYELSHKSGFPIIQIGRRRLVPVRALEEWLKEQTGKAV